MPEQLKPCPNQRCAHDLPPQMMIGHVYYIKCACCDTQGPYMPSEAAAINAWNQLPRALTWTTEPPKVAGWYWVRCTAADDFPIIKHVAQRDATAALLKREWAGPIPAPLEPEES